MKSRICTCKGLQEYRLSYLVYNLFKDLAVAPLKVSYLLTNNRSIEYFNQLVIVFTTELFDFCFQQISFNLLYLPKCSPASLLSVWNIVNSC